MRKRFFRAGDNLQSSRPTRHRPSAAAPEDDAAVDVLMADRTRRRTRRQSAIHCHSFAGVRWSVLAENSSCAMSAPSCCRRHRQSQQRECALSRTSRVFAIVLLLQSIVTTAAATDGFGRLAPFSGSGSGGEEETSPTTPSVSTTSPPTSSPPGNRGKKEASGRGGI